MRTCGGIRRQLCGLQGDQLLESKGAPTATQPRRGVEELVDHLVARCAITGRRGSGRHPDIAVHEGTMDRGVGALGGPAAVFGKFSDDLAASGDTCLARPHCREGR